MNTWSASRIESEQHLIRGWRLWAASAAAWLLISFVGSLRYYSAYVIEGGGIGRRVVIRWEHHFLMELLPNTAWVLLTPLIVILGRRCMLSRSSWWKYLPLHVVAALVFGALPVMVRSSVSFWPEGGPRLASTEVALAQMGRLLPEQLSKNVVLYFVILGAGAALDLYARYRVRERAAAALALQASRLEAEVVRASLAALQAQLHPHFLFNTLHGISSLIDWRPDEARRMLVDLSELLRMTLARSTESEIALADELDWSERYLDLQHMRFEDRLTIRMDIEPETLSARVPPLLLQPVLENALTHGVAASSSPACIRLAAERVGDVLRITVEDDGPGPPAADKRTEGIGLGNTRQRLHTLYGTAARLELAPRPEGGARCTIELPFQTTNAPHSWPTASASLS